MTHTMQHWPRVPDDQYGRSVVQPVRADLPVQRRPGEAQGLRREHLVARALFASLHYQLGLGGLHRAQTPAEPFDPERRWEVVDVDEPRRLAAHPSHQCPQLGDVAWPAVMT